MKRTVAAVAFALALPSTAGASGWIVPIGPEADAPVLAGGSAIYGRYTGKAYQLVLRRQSLRQRRHVRVPHRARIQFGEAWLAASPNRVALSLDVLGCRHGDCGDRFDAFNGVFTGRLGRRVTPLAHSCPRHVSFDESTWSAPPVDVWGDVVAYADCDRAVHVVDGASVDHGGPPAADALRVAGPYLATWRSPDELTVSNWRTGATLFTLDEVSLFDIDSDGTVAFTDSGDHHPPVAWASPAEPTPHVLVRALTTRPRAAGRRIAYTVIELEGMSVEVRLRNGALVAAAHDPTATRAADFDGQRLSWLTQPCQQTWLVVWEGVGTVPRPPPGQCPFPRFRPGSARVDARGRLSVRVDCPYAQGLGCAGLAGVRNPAYRDADDDYGFVDWQEYSADPGATGRVRFKRARARICRDRRGRLRTELLAGVFARPGTAESRRRDRARTRSRLVTVRGEPRHDGSCRSGAA